MHTRNRIRAVVAMAMALSLVFANVALASIQVPSQASGSNAGSGASSLVVDRPANVVAGDLLLAQVTFEKGTEIDIVIEEIVPSSPGWTLVQRDNHLANLGQAIFRRVATASEPASYTWGFKKATDGSIMLPRASGGILRLTGVDATSPILASSGLSGDSTSLTAPSVDAGAGSLMVAFFGIQKKTPLTPPSNQPMTDAYFQQHSNDSGPTIRGRYETRTVAGATGDRTATAGASSKWVAQQVVLKAAPNTAPTLNLPENITVAATSAAGAVVTYTATATDAEDNPNPTPTCTPTSGSTFTEGETTVNCSVTDKDGLTTRGSFKITVAAYVPPNTCDLTGTFLAPIKDGSRNIVKLGNVIPVKVSVTDCNGNAVTNRTLSIRVASGVADPQDVEGESATISTSVASADTTGVMRLADGHYMYNLATKSLSGGFDYTIWVKDTTGGVPWNTAPVVGTAVIQPKK
jgi:hypothetical protein